MIISSVQFTNNGGYKAVTDQGIYTVAPGSTDVYGQAVAAWIAAGNVPLPAETDGDLLVKLRLRAAQAIDELKAENSVGLRAIIIELLEYANAERVKFNSLLQYLGGQTSLTQRGQLTAMQLPIATRAEAKTAIKNRIQNGQAD